MRDGKLPGPSPSGGENRRMQPTEGQGAAEAGRVSQVTEKAQGKQTQAAGMEFFLMLPVPH